MVGLDPEGIVCGTGVGFIGKGSGIMLPDPASAVGVGAMRSSNTSVTLGDQEQISVRIICMTNVIFKTSGFIEVLRNKSSIKSTQKLASCTTDRCLARPHPSLQERH